MSETDRNDIPNYTRICSHIERLLQNGIQTINDFLSNSSNGIIINVVPETKYDNRIHNIIAENTVDSKPLSFITLLDSDKNSAEDIANQIRAFLVACGHEVCDSNNTPWKAPDHMSEGISGIFGLVSAFSSFKIVSENNEENSTWDIRLCCQEESVTLISEKSLSYRSASVIERQIAMFLAAMNKTVEVSDGTKINIYGCVYISL